MTPDPGGLPPVRGWPGRDAGRTAHPGGGTAYQGTTTQLCGLFPFMAGCGAPLAGTPVGRHMLWGEVVCLDPLAWLRAGLVTNPGMMVLGQPGTGKSTLVKRLLTGAVATGTRALVLGDSKPDYTALVTHLGGQVIRVGRGLDRINPLDAGPLGAALTHLGAAEATRLRAEVRSRRINLLLALAVLIRGHPIGNAEEVLLAAAVDLLDQHNPNRPPTLPEVLAVLDQGPQPLRDAARAPDETTYRARAADLVITLDLLTTGSLNAVFDGPTTQPLDPDARAVSLDISAVGADDKLLTAAMLCTWAYAHATLDATAALPGAPRHHLVVMDELWRALRGGPGLADYADGLTRLNRAKGTASIMITHSLDDLEALATAHDRAKVRGLVERCAITVLAGLPPRELTRVAEVVSLTTPERELVASWSAPESWRPGTGHPGRGRYLIKTGQRLGIPVQLTLVGAETDLYDTDQAIRRPHPQALEQADSPYGQSNSPYEGAGSPHGQTGSPHEQARSPHRHRGPQPQTGGPYERVDSPEGMSRPGRAGTR